MLGDQFANHINKNIVKALNAGAESVADNINKRVDEIVDNGQKYNQGKYKNSYSRSHAKTRKRRKYQTAYVDLQMDRQTVKQRLVQKIGDGTYRISFRPIQIRDGLMSDTLFYYHNWGEGLNPRRQLFPDTKGGKSGGVQTQINANRIDGSNEYDPADVIPKKIRNDAIKAVRTELRK